MVGRSGYSTLDIVSFLAAIFWLSNYWKSILSLPGAPSPQLRVKISWHLFVCEPYFEIPTGYPIDLRDVSSKSPHGAEDKRLARILLRNFMWCEKVNVSFLENKNYLIAERVFCPGITCTCVSLQKRLVAVAVEDGTYSIWKLSLLKEYCKCSTGCSILCCTFSPDNSILNIRLDRCFDVSTKKKRSLFVNNEESFLSCSFPPSGQRLLTANDSLVIKLWDMTDQSLLALLPCGCPVDSCTSSESGLFIIGKLSKNSRYSKASNTMSI